MPKMKTRSSATKRFKLTASGKIKKNKANKSHLLKGKSMDRKRSLRKGTEVSKSDTGRVKSMIGK